MTDRSDDRLATLLVEAMAAHEGEVDPGRARQLAAAAEPARRRWPAAVAAAAVVLLLSGVTVYLAGRSADDAATPGSGSTATGGGPASPAAGADQGTTEENYQRAAAASEAALASLPVPDGAVRLAGKPRGWPAGGMSLGPSDASLTRTAWWSTPMAKDELAAFLTNHAPVGMRHPAGEDVIVDGNSNGIANTVYDVVAPADPTAYTGPSLLVQFTQIADHTVLRADTFLAARYAVSERHRITDDVVAVRIDRIRPADLGNDEESGTLPTVRLNAPEDAAQIGRLVDAFNGLDGSVTVPGYVSCPQTLPAKDTVTFSTAAQDGTTGTVVAVLEPDCFGQIHVTINGSPLHVTLDPGRWDLLVNHIAAAADY